MQIVILAAGLGSRLGRGVPKALVEVAGKTMLEYQMEWVKSFDPERVIVISGYHHDDMKSFCDKKFPEAILVENKRYKEQNLYSLLAAEDYLDDDTLIMNVDHIYPDTFAKRVAPQLKEIENYAIFADTERSLTDDDMKVFVNSDGKVEKISKKLTEWNAGYIGMTFIKKGFWKEYFAAADKVAEDFKEKAVVEMVIQELVNGSFFPEIINSDAIKWYEIDTPEEHAVAEKELSVVPERTAVEIVLVDMEKKLPDFAATDIFGRWKRQLKKLNIDNEYSERTVQLSKLSNELKNSKGKQLFIFSDSVVDEFTVEYVAESLFQDVGENEIVLVRNEKYSAAPLFIAGTGAQKKLSEWHGLGEGDLKVDEIAAHFESSEEVTVSEKEYENGFWKRIEDERSSEDAEWDYLQFLQFRPGGLVAKYLNRPVSIRITRKIIKYEWMTPNVVTGLDFIIGLIALSFFLIPNYWVGVLGAVLFHFNSIVDGVDGEVARMRLHSSKFGANFDSFCDETLGALLYLAIGYHLYLINDSVVFFIFGIVSAIVSYTYAMVNFHSRYKKGGIGFYYWWDLNKPVKVLSRKPTVMFYVKRLFWRDSIIFFLMFMAVFQVLDIFITVSFISALVTATLMFIHIFIKKAEW